MRRSLISRICGNNCVYKAINCEIVRLKRAFDELNLCINTDCCKKNEKNSRK